MIDDDSDLPEGTDAFAVDHAPWCDDFFPERDLLCPMCGNRLEASNCVLKCSRCNCVAASCDEAWK